MTNSMRFGRRLGLPSTLQIKHELMLLMREDARVADAKKAEAARIAAVPDQPLTPT